MWFLIVSIPDLYPLSYFELCKELLGCNFVSTIMFTYDMLNINLSCFSNGYNIHFILTMPGGGGGGGGFSK